MTTGHLMPARLTDLMIEAHADFGRTERSTDRRMVRKRSAETPIKEHAMATIHLNQTTTATPGQFLAGLTDFGPGRSELFGNSADGYLKVHDQGPSQADVTEGSGGVWERLHYDWSDPHRITMTTTDSNVWGGRSGHTYHRDVSESEMTSDIETSPKPPTPHSRSSSRPSP